MTRYLLAVGLIGLLSAGSVACAQTGQSAYTETQLRNLSRSNSTGAFTSNAMRSTLINRTVPRYAFSQVNRDLFSSSFSPRRSQKPFSGGRRPGVTPYLALSEPFSSSATSYYTQVRPQLEQQRINQQNQARAAQMQRQLISMAARPPYDPSGSPYMAPTGHVAVYMNYGGYYQPVQVPVRR